MPEVAEKPAQYVRYAGKPSCKHEYISLSSSPWGETWACDGCDRSEALKFPELGSRPEGIKFPSGAFIRPEKGFLNSGLDASVYCWKADEKGSFIGLPEGQRMRRDYDGNGGVTFSKQPATRDLGSKVIDFFRRL